MGEKENSEFIICVNLRHLRAIPDSAAAGRTVDYGHLQFLKKDG
jgi:hypothetical protein